MHREQQTRPWGVGAFSRVWTKFVSLSHDVRSAFVGNIARSRAGQSFIVPRLRLCSVILNVRFLLLGSRPK